MEVSNEIKEDIRRIQSDLKNAIRVHQAWVARLQEDDNNVLYKCKVKEAEKDIIAVSQTQKAVVERLRRELELYQQRLKLRNKHVNCDNDVRYVAQQLRDHQIQHCNKNRTSLLKPSVLTEIHIRNDNTNGDKPPSDDASDSETKLSNGSEGKENGNCSEDTSDKFAGSLARYPNSVSDSRNNFANALNKVKETFMGGKLQSEIESWQQSSELVERSDSDGSLAGTEPCPASPTPSPPPPPLPNSPHAVSQETFLRFLGLITPRQKEELERKRSERRKRCTTSTNRNEFIYDNFEMQPKRKKYNNFPYLQTCTPPQTRSQRLRKQQQPSPASREPSPSHSAPVSNDIKGWGRAAGGSSTAWLAGLPAGLTVEPVTSESKACAGCGRSDVPSLLVWCGACGVRLHTGCGLEGRCPSCRAPLPDPAHVRTSAHSHIYRDKMLERKRLRERNIELCAELRKLESRAVNLKESIEMHNEEKRDLLARQIQTQRNLQKLLDVMSQFKDTAGAQSTSASDCSESKSNDD